jgi:hypothetical protein
MMRPSKLAAGANCTAGSVASLFLSLWIFFQNKERVERGEEELGCQSDVTERKTLRL